MLHLWTAIQSRMTRDESGAGMVEYALLIGLIGVLLVLAIGALTAALDTSIRDSAAKIPSSAS